MRIVSVFRAVITISIICSCQNEGVNKIAAPETPKLVGMNFFDCADNVIIHINIEYKNSRPVTMILAKSSPQKDTTTLEFLYDSKQRLIQRNDVLSLPTSSGVQEYKTSIVYEYDLENRPSKATFFDDIFGESTNAEAQFYTTFEFTENGFLLSQRSYSVDGATEGMRIDYSYHPSGNVMKKSWILSDGSVLESTDMSSYDDKPNPVKFFEWGFPDELFDPSLNNPLSQVHRNEEGEITRTITFHLSYDETGLLIGKYLEQSYPSVTSTECAGSIQYIYSKSTELN